MHPAGDIRSSASAPRLASTSVACVSDPAEVARTIGGYLCAQLINRCQWRQAADRWDAWSR
jgi:hypothetical protein